MSKLTAVAVAAALLLIPRTVAAHTDDELDDWMTTWGYRTLTEGVTLYSLTEYTDMDRRHPSYFGRPVPHTHPRRILTGNVEQWRQLVAAYFRAADVNRALRIMACESGGDPNAYNRSGASGLFQHMRRYWSTRSATAGFADTDPFNPTANVAVAAWLRDQAGGWQHWVCQ